MSTQEYPLALPVGAVLAGQYTIDKVLGQGGFGITYKATDYNTKAKVAIKEFFPDSLAYRSVTTVVSHPGERTENFQFGKESFLQEAQTLSEFIGCENIVRIHSYFEENGTAYFVMDYVEGTSFDEYIKSKGGKIAYEDAERILLPVMDALAVVHSKGIIHRDVTPDNIFITNEGVVKLLDFGAARYSLGDKSRSLDVILKHGFAPKEQYTRRGKQGTYTDVYSLGATFYFALTGKRPPDSVERIDEDSLVLPSARGIEIPRAKEDAIIKALNVQANERFQSMAEFKSALMGETVPNVNPTPVVEQVFYAPPQQQAPVSNTSNQYNSVNQIVPKDKSKKTLIIAIASVIVVVAIIATVVSIVSLSKKSNGDNETTKYVESEVTQETTKQPQPTTTEPQPTTTAPQPTTTAPPKTTAPAKGNAYIVGNTVGNIRNGGLILSDNTAFIDEEYTALYFNGNRIFKDDGKFSNLIKYNGYIYFIYDKYVYKYEISSGNHYKISELDRYSSDDMELYISEDYYFIYSSETLYRVSMKTGKEEDKISIWKKSFTFCGDNLCYIQGEVGKDTNSLYMTSLLDFSKGTEYWYTKDGWKYNNIISDGSYIYVTVVYWQETEYYTNVCKFTSDLENRVALYDFTDKCKELAGSKHWISSFNVVNNQMVVSLQGDKDWTKYGIYHLNLNSETPKWTTIKNYGLDSENVAISVVDNGYNYTYIEDGISYYNSFDFNGNLIKIN